MPGKPVPHGKLVAAPWRVLVIGRERTLLERIAAVGERAKVRSEPSPGEDVQALMDSVRRHLARLLNSRHGLSEAMPDYGLPALTDLTVGSGDYVLAIQEAIRTAVEKYDPRLRRVQVSRATDESAPHVLSFRVEGTLVGRSGQHRVYYQTTVSGQGQFDVAD